MQNNIKAPDHFNRAEARAYAGIMLSKRTKKEKFNLLGLRFYPKLTTLFGKGRLNNASY